MRCEQWERRGSYILQDVTRRGIDKGLSTGGDEVVLADVLLHLDGPVDSLLVYQTGSLLIIL